MIRAIAVITALVALQSPGLAASPPREAIQAGFRKLTFSTDRFDKSTVDTAQSYTSGFKWYGFNFYKWKQPADFVSLNADGTATVKTLRNNANAAISSAAQVPGSNDFVGTVFGGGGYFEAEIAFDSEAVNARNGWPAWWAISIESALDLPGSFWKGQSDGYRNTAEVDFFEYDSRAFGMGNRAYGAGIHHWYGLRGSCKGSGLCDYSLPFRLGNKFAPPLTDWSQFHRLGALWIPATDTRRGSMTFFLDGKQMGQTIVWSKFNDQPPPPTFNTPWSFGILDRQHLVLTLGAGMDAPMRVRSVEVWQATADSDLTR